MLRYSETDHVISQILNGHPSLKPTTVPPLPSLCPMFSNISLLRKNCQMGSGMLPDSLPSNGTNKTRLMLQHNEKYTKTKRKFPNPNPSKINPNFKRLFIFFNLKHNESTCEFSIPPHIESKIHNAYTQRTDLYYCHQVFPDFPSYLCLQVGLL